MVREEVRRRLVAEHELEPAVGIGCGAVGGILGHRVAPAAPIRDAPWRGGADRLGDGNREGSLCGDRGQSDEPVAGRVAALMPS